MRALLALACVLAAAAAEYRFSIDGAPVEPVVVPLTAGPTHPAPGDLVWLGDLPLVLGEAGDYRLATAGALLAEPGAEPAPARIDLAADPAPLLALTAAQRRRLRLITVGDPAACTPAFLAALADVDPARAVLDIELGAAGVVPNLPTDRRCLVLRRSRAAADGVDLRPLQAPSQLVWLRLVDLGREVSVAPLLGVTGLRRLECVRTRLSMRPAFRFVATHPDAVVDLGWRAALGEVFAQVDRVVVSDVGKGREAVLAEERDPALIGELLAALDIAASGPSCACRGSLSFALESRGVVLATLSLHHGRSLRWNGRMPLDGHLDPAAAPRLAAWLAAHGAPDVARAVVQRAAGPPPGRVFPGDDPALDALDPGVDGVEAPPEPRVAPLIP